jgi:hypothetical protein
LLCYKKKKVEDALRARFDPLACVTHSLVDYVSRVITFAYVIKTSSRNSTIRDCSQVDRNDVQTAVVMRVTNLWLKK